MIDEHTIAVWREYQGKGMESALCEYVPPEFWQLLDAYEALRKGAEAMHDAILWHFDGTASKAEVTAAVEQYEDARDDITEGEKHG